MFLESIYGNKFELKIENYQFPDANDYWDGNWLLITISVYDNGKNSSLTDPSLTVPEVHYLINWFNDHLNGTKNLNSELEFTEPNIAFNFNNLTSETIDFDLILCLECLPKFHKDSREYVLNMDCSKSALSKWLEDLKLQLKKFPQKE